MSAANQTQPEGKTFLGHPVGLYVLFFTEMWERFSYYGMRALLVIYMVKYFRWVQEDASSIYKWYTSLVYVTPILGGFLADRYLGNRLAVIIGATLMAIGHFLMAFEPKGIFFTALVFLIIGNGFFKPNMSTQVGRLYPANDPRRDGAYTIFYMGINLGAALAPLACGWVQENTVGGFHSGFALAGIGMVLGLVIYLLGMPFVKEIQLNDQPVGNPLEAINADNRVLSEKEAENTPSKIGWLSTFSVKALFALACFLLGLAVWKGFHSLLAGATPLLCSLSLFVVVWVINQIHNAMRDRVLTIVALGFFGIFFWAAFEQAGNALNLWADNTTNRYLLKPMPDVQIFPDPPAVSQANGANGTSAAAGFWQMFKLKENRQTGALGVDPVPTAWFQAINAVAIFIMAPFFALLWLRWQISIPMKMTLGIFLMSLSFVVMIASAYFENQPVSVEFKGKELPKSIQKSPQGHLLLMEKGSKEGHPLQGGRMYFDAANKTFHMRGVLADIDRDRVAWSTAPPDYAKLLAQAKETLEEQQKGKNEKLNHKFRLPESVRGFDIRYAGMSETTVKYQENERTLVFSNSLDDKGVKALLLAGADPEFRGSMDELMVKSSRSRVSPWWLLWSYIFATLGELCLSPVGLSMANKLAPAKFATMLMGLWLLVSAFGNFAAGALGETYGSIPPLQYFSITTLALAAAAVVLLLISRKLTSMMHGVS